MDLLPPDISVLEGSILVVVSFLTSALTAAFGLGGGVTFLAVLATLVPAPAVIPIHGIVQLGSNIGRVAVHRRRIDWALSGVFVAGSVVGVAIGGQVVVALPDYVLKTVIGVFLIFAVWTPARLRLGATGHAVPALTGLVTAFLSMFVGAVGPLTVAVIAARLPDRHAFIGTHATCMMAQHALKLVVFGVLGFAFAPWLPLVAAIVATGFLGTLAGTHVLGRLNEETFRTALKVLLTVLAANILAEALGLYGWLFG